MLDFRNIDNSRDGLMSLVELIDMFGNGEIYLEPCRYMLYYPVSPEERFLHSLLNALKSQLKLYAHFLGTKYKDDYIDWIMEGGREGYEKVMLDVHKKSDPK